MLSNTYELILKLIQWEILHATEYCGGVYMYMLPVSALHWAIRGWGGRRGEGQSGACAVRDHPWQPGIVIVSTRLIVVHHTLLKTQNTEGPALSVCG